MGSTKGAKQAGTGPAPFAPFDSCRLTEALLDVGEPREATRRATEASRYLQQTGSARMRRQFARFSEKAVPWTTTSVGRGLNDVLDSIRN